VQNASYETNFEGNTTKPERLNKKCTLLFDILVYCEDECLHPV